MLRLAAATHWSTLINSIIQSYFMHSLTTCIIWPKEFDFDLATPGDGNLNPFLIIKRDNLEASLEQEIYKLSENLEHLAFDTLALKLVLAIEQTHCEAFIAFEEDINEFARAFRNASFFSLWTSQRNKFLFVYSRDRQQEVFFEDLLFIDQPNILIIEAASYNATEFLLKTNKFVGSVREKPQQLLLLDTYDALQGSFARGAPLYPDKVQDLQGRELVVGAFDYRPFTVVDFEIQPQLQDLAADNPNRSVHLDGTEVRLALMFCELYNCTVQADSSEHEEWGQVYKNASGDGLFGMLVERKVHLIVGAFYLWEIDYVGMSTFLGRSGVTCMVPAPVRLTSWNLPLKPFQFTLWLGVAACLVIETLALLVARHLEQSIEQRDGADPSSDHSWLSSFRFGYHTTLKLFISQGSDYVVSSFSVRTVLVSCYMIDIIVTSIYGGGLSAILTLPALSEVADSMERLYKFGIPWSATSMDWVNTIKKAKDNPIIVSLLSNYRISTFDEMRENAKTENMGFVLERMAFGHFGNGEFLTPEAFKHLKLMVDDIYFQFTVAFVPKAWPFLAKYNSLVYAWHSSGFSKFWEWRVSADYLNEIEQEQIQASMSTNLDVGPVQLGMENFAGLILVWLVGMLLSVLGFGLELLWYKHMKNRARAKRLDAESNVLKSNDKSAHKGAEVF